LALDLLTKAIVGWTMEPGERIRVIGDFFTFHFVFNPYAGAGFLRGWFRTRLGLRIFFIIFTTISVAIFSVAMYKFRGKHWLSRVTFALIIGGALGNFYDRLFVIIPYGTPLSAGGSHAGYHGVRDFFAFRFGSWAAPVFNVADMALVGGVIVFAIYFIFMHKSPPPPLVGPVYQSDWGKESAEDSEETNHDITTNGLTLSVALGNDILVRADDIRLTDESIESFESNVGQHPPPAARRRPSTTKPKHAATSCKKSIHKKPAAEGDADA